MSRKSFLGGIIEQIGEDLGGCLLVVIVILFFTGGLGTLLSGLWSFVGSLLKGIFVFVGLALCAAVAMWGIAGFLWGTFVFCTTVFAQRRELFFTEFQLSPCGLWFIWRALCLVLNASDASSEEKLCRELWNAAYPADFRKRFLALPLRVPIWAGVLSFLLPFLAICLLIALFHHLVQLLHLFHLLTKRALKQ